VRLVPTPRQPLRVIVDSRLETPPDARILQAPGGALIFAAQPHIERQAELMLRGAEVAYCANPQGKVDLAEMLNELGRRGINELHVEAGHQLNGSFVREGLVDEYLVYVAPKLLGLGLPLASLGPLAALSEAPALAFHSVTPIGDDLRLLLRPR
jgi:diaminohydroxyphosphoribosylaminopyrimidine deaminase/5-amino-6-(5-phosphoribosylamino)uracil reductase